MSMASSSVSGERASERSGGLRVITATSLFAAMAEWMWFSIALVAAFKVSGTEGAGAVAVAAVLPAMIASPAISYLTDRLQPQQMIHCALALRTLVLAAAMICSSHLQVLWVLVVLIGLEGCSALTVTPAMGTLLPWLVSSPAELVRANFRFTVAESSGRLLGPALGGVLLEMVGFSAAFGVALAVSLVSLAASLRLRHDVRRSPASHSHHGVLREMGAGFVALARERGPLAIAVAVTAIFMVQGVLEVALVPLAYESLNLGPSGPGILLAAIGGGGIAAGFSLSILLPRRGLGRQFFMAATAAGVFIAFVGVLPRSAVAFPSIILYGAGLSASFALGSTLLERFVPEELIGRVLGLVEALIFGGQAIGAGLAPVLVDAIGMRITLLITGALLMVVAAMTLPVMRRMDKEDVTATGMLDVLAQVPFLAALPIARGERLARTAVHSDLAAGEIVFRQGEFGDQFYVIVAGDIEVLVDGELVRTLGPGDSFGEIALLRRIPRTATVKAVVPSRVVSVSRCAFLEAATGRREVVEIDSGMMTLPTVRLWDPVPFLDQAEMSHEAQARNLIAVPLLSRLSPRAAGVLTRHAEVIDVATGATLFEQGAEADAYYVIATGEVQFCEDGEFTGSLGPGHGFGELALLRGTPRTAAALAKTQTTLLRFPARPFIDVIMRNEQVNKGEEYLFGHPDA